MHEAVNEQLQELSDAADPSAVEAVQQAINDMSAKMKDEGLTGEEIGEALLEVLADPAARHEIVKRAVKSHTKDIHTMGKRAGLNRSQRRQAKKDARKVAQAHKRAQQ